MVYSSVLSRGVVGDRSGHPFVISPISRKAFSLETGECLDAPEYSVQTHSVRVSKGRLQVRLRLPQAQLVRDAIGT